MFGLLDVAEEKQEEVDLQEVVYAYAMRVFGELAYDVSLASLLLDLTRRSFQPDRRIHYSQISARSRQLSQDLLTERQSKHTIGSLTLFTGSPSSSYLQVGG
jgi:hypothetical protein